MDDLPDKVIPFTQLVINRDKKKKCTCRIRGYVVDVNNREIECSKCGAIIDPFDALEDMARNRERLQHETERLLEQREQILAWKPWLLPIRKLEAVYRGGDVLCCPHCRKGILAEELTYTNCPKSVELKRREKEAADRG